MITPAGRHEAGARELPTARPCRDRFRDRPFGLMRDGRVPEATSTEQRAKMTGVSRSCWQCQYPCCSGQELLPTFLPGEWSSTNNDSIWLGALSRYQLTLLSSGSRRAGFTRVFGVNPASCLQESQPTLQTGIIFQLHLPVRPIID